MLLWFRKKFVLIPKGLISLIFILGIWILGTFATMASASLAGAGFTKIASFSDWKDLIVLTLCFPLSTFECTTYDGTLGALFAFSLFVLIWILIDVIVLVKKGGKKKLAIDRT